MSGQAVFFIRPFFVTQAGQRVWIGERSSWEQWIGLKLNFPSWVQVEKLNQPGCWLRMRPPSSQRWRPTWTNHSRRQSWPKSTSWGCFFQPKEDIFCQYIHIWCPSCQEWHYWSSTRNWRLDPRHVRTHFQPFLILLSFSFQFWNPPPDTFPSHLWHYWTLFSPTLNHMGWFSS